MPRLFIFDFFENFRDRNVFLRTCIHQHPAEFGQGILSIYLCLPSQCNSVDDTARVYDNGLRNKRLRGGHATHNLSTEGAKQAKQAKKDSLKDLSQEARGKPAPLAKDTLGTSKQIKTIRLEFELSKPEEFHLLYFPYRDRTSSAGPSSSPLVASLQANSNFACMTTLHCQEKGSMFRRHEEG